MPLGDLAQIKASKEQQGRYHESGLFCLVRKYCQIITSHVLSERERKIEEEILNFALYDPELDYWIERAEHYFDIEKEKDQSPTFDVVFSHLLLDKFICTIENLDKKSISSEQFKQLISDFRFEPGFISREAKFQENKVFKSHLVSQPPLNIYIACWVPGQWVKFHHHGRAKDVVKVFQGILHHEFRHGSQHPNTPMTKLGSQAFKADSLIAIDENCYHRLGNLSDQKLITITFRLNLDPRIDKATPLHLPHPLIRKEEIRQLCRFSFRTCTI